ncbi:hypothetical protein HII31_02852 [Pseudocercospora fuligena]|uniref:Uncharacterized protein n=1 Tax=Pseudocercospora fuligena TaxID=685502 RepID=A0A8H6VL77_9PEZI|nr:hypothetical protein HII31_02852 [Pseudocercospora fuligena]
MSVPITVIAAGLYSKTAIPERDYPWAGMVLAGYGTEPTQAIIEARGKFATNVYDPNDFPFGHNPEVHIGPFLKEDKISLMMGSEGTCDPALRELCWKQNTPFFLDEVINMGSVWQARSEELKADVTIPVLYAMGTQEWLWKHTKAHVDDFTKGFINAPRIEGALITGAPHAIEWSRVGAGWWTRVFGWAAEVTAGLEIAKLGLKDYE